MQPNSYYWRAGAILFLFNSGLQVSGIASILLTSILWGLAVALFSIGAYRWYKDRKAVGRPLVAEPWYLIAFGLTGAAICLAVAGGGYIWQRLGPSSMAAGPTLATDSLQNNSTKRTTLLKRDPPCCSEAKRHKSLAHPFRWFNSV
jgi:hypothetical protein